MLNSSKRKGSLELDVDLEEGEVPKEEEDEVEPVSPLGVDLDPDDDERMWFKHPKAVRKAIRQKLWNSTLKVQPHKEGLSVRSRGFSSGTKFPL
ncbi:unnamed protein product [Eruca vesicaria subsp. sativa]|uniref:Uncharacterized protein n=1 Tax=Eruca vesicaria subsp. sativa TaxID=29727 RepID=A0ABC8LLA1_ERUVS|nr:unnamed protein product [Eruca vesicaria subsp. sativa]